MRPRRHFAARHLRGSLSVQLGVWVGWLLAYNAPLILVADPDLDAAEAVVELARVGFDDVRGLLCGVDSWAEEGRPTARLDMVASSPPPGR